MKKTAIISAILAVIGFMAVYVALCYLVPCWRLKQIGRASCRERV